MKSEKIIHKALADAKAYIEGPIFALERDQDFKNRIALAYELGLLRAEIRGLCRELAEFSAPMAGSQHECTYATDAGEYVVHFDYTEGEDATMDCPGRDPEVDINAVYLHGADVLGDLSNSVMDRIQDACNEAIDQARADSKADVAADRWEDRRAE